MGRSLVFDLETTAIGVVPVVVHILVIVDVDTGQKFTFRQNDKEDNIRDGIAMLNEADVIIGHNIIGYDCRILWEVYGDLFNPQGIIRDTLPMARMVFAAQKEDDFKLWKRGTLEGKLIGSHELKAWGQRLGHPKGDYMEKRLAELEEQFPEMSKEERMIICWSKWNQEMEDYSGRDAEVTIELWKKIIAKRWSPDAILLEHQIHDMMERVTQNGFPFDLDEARKLEDHLRIKHEELSGKAIKHFGSWWVPKKWKGDEHTTYVSPQSFEEEKDQKRFKPREIFGEDISREWWGEVAVPKRSIHYNDNQRGDTEKGCAFCPVEVIEFNPNSRQQIVNRLQKLYGWEPQEFTETGQPSVNDEILRELANTIEICDELAEIFYYKKRLGQLIDGKNGLIKKAEERGDGRIHGRINTGGTVTNRASHSNPNLAQVPRVVFKNLLQWEEKDAAYGFEKGKIIYGREVDGEFLKGGLTPRINPDTGEQFKAAPVLDKDGHFKREDSGLIKLKKSLLKARAGDHGWDFRNLFYVPDGWQLMGADQKGIELRCLGNFMAPFDDGAYLKLCVESDPHDLHQQVLELDNRDTAKTFIYACVPMDTTVLTRRGWKKHDELILGEDVLSYNAETKLKEWTPLLEVVRYDDAPIMSIRSSSNTFITRCTPNHRWFVSRDGVPEVVTAEELDVSTDIIMDADSSGLTMACTSGDWIKDDLGRAPVWCVRTKNESFVMRQDDVITITGNTIYGAQPYKLGTIIDPSLANYPTRAKAVGQEMLRRIMTRIPALGAVVKAVQREAQKGYILGLDGRHLYVRGAHSALNTKLQAAAATIAKKWCVLFEQMMEDEGYRNGWNGDFAVLLWCHDELQQAVKDDPKVLTRAREICIEAALEAGRSFNFACNIDIDVKFGRTWAATH